MKRTFLMFPLLMACGGSIPPPNERLAAAESGARGAEELGANSNPQASLHLKYAREQIEEAKKLIANDENERAASVLTRASADAELAVMLAKEQKSRVEADAAKEKIKSVGGGK